MDTGQKTPAPMSVFNDRECQLSVIAHTIYGYKNRVKLSDLSQIHVDGNLTTEASESETTARRLMWWLVGIATVVATIVGIFALLAIN